MMDDKPLLTVYGTPTCPQIPPLRAALNRADVPYEYVNIHQDDEARQRVGDINDGAESVPTLVFANGTTLTEPSTAALNRALKAHGYGLDPLAWLANNAIALMTGIIVVLALLRFLGVL